MKQRIFTNKNIIKQYNSNNFIFTGCHYNVYNNYNSADSEKILELVKIINSWIESDEKQSKTNNIVEPIVEKSTNVEETTDNTDYNISENNFVKNEDEPETITDVITRIPDKTNVNNYDEIEVETTLPVTVMGAISEMLKPIETDDVENFWKTFDN